MGATLRSWWLRIKGPLEVIIVSAFLVGLVVLIILIILGYRYNWDWTGLGPVNSEPKQHMKTLWDWLQLLIIPAVLAVGGYAFNLTTSRNERRANEQRAKSEREAAEKRDQTEREIAQDNQREAALLAYIDNMSELLLEKNLRKSGKDDEVRTIARVRTLTVFPRLDGRRKASVLQFLHESGLIDKGKSIIDLNGADLRGADLLGAILSRASLRGADLEKSDLREADLSEADLSEADLFLANMSGARLHEAVLLLTNLFFADLSFSNLRGANLSEATLTQANLSEANLSEATVSSEQLQTANSLEGTTMPNGSIHP